MQGLRFPRAAVGHGLLVPKLQGTYEQELHSTLETAIARSPSQVIDVGAAEGYYAVGLALRLPGASVIAADIAPSARRLCASVARENAVSERVRIVGALDAEALAALASDAPSLLVLDCEGAEVELITERSRPSLRSSELIIEVHDFVVTGATERLESVLTPTHAVRRIETSRRLPPPDLVEAMGADEAARLVGEGRPAHGIRWLHAEPRHG